MASPFVLIYRFAPYIVVLFLLRAFVLRWMTARRFSKNPDGVGIMIRSRIIAGLIAASIFAMIAYMLPRTSHEIWLRIAVGAAGIGGLEQVGLAATPGGKMLEVQYRVFSVVYALAAVVILIVALQG